MQPNKDDAFQSGFRALNSKEIESVVGGMAHVLISDDCCKNPQVTWTCDSNGCSGPIVDCD